MKIILDPHGIAVAASTSWSRSVAQAKGITPAQAVYCLAQLNGVTPLSGTTDEKHMLEDLAVERIELSPEDEKSLKAIVQWMGLSGA